MTADYWNHNTAFHRELVWDAGLRGGRALDVGCGEGLLCSRLAGVCREVIGIDTDERALARAQRRLERTPKARALSHDIMEQDLPGCLGAFETVTCVAVLHHLPLEEGLAALGALVAPGGRLIVIGLAADKSPWDWIVSGLSVLPIRVMSAWHRETRDIGVATTRARESLEEIRAAASRILPGARVRRRFYYRYSLVWDRPREAGGAG